MRELAMKNRIRVETVQLLLAPIVALKELKGLIVQVGQDDDNEHSSKSTARILLDKDGNATLNLDNEDVKRQMREHLEALESINVITPDANDRQSPTA